jgi:integrase
MKKATTMAQRLTDKIVKALPAPATGNKLHYDAEVKGFAARVTAAGARAFVLNYRAGGRERRYTIGSFPEWTTVAARKEAGHLKKLVDKGHDPMGDRHEERAAPTVHDLIDRFVSDYLAKKRESTRREYRAILEKIVRPELGGTKVSDLRHADVDRLHRKVSQRAPYRANRMLAVLSKSINFSITLGWRDDNPVRGVERNHEDRRERFLSPAEMAFLSHALQAHWDQRSANAIRLLMLTGARKNEVLSATWDQFDLAAGVWVKPSAHTKQKKTHRIPLSAPAVQLLIVMRDQQAARENAERKAGRTLTVCPFLFPGNRAGASLTDIKKGWAAVTARATVALWASQPETPAGDLIALFRPAGESDALPSLTQCRAAAKARGVTLPAGLTDVRLHDLRHGFAAILASSGLSLPIIGALLGHTQPGTTSRYAHLFDDPLRAATERVGAIVAGAAADSANSAEIYPIRKG